MKIKALEDKRISTYTQKSMKPGKAILSVYVDAEIADELARIAELEHVKKSVLMRYVFEEFVKSYNKKK